MRYLISIGLLVLLAIELVLFVKIIGRYRKRFVPLTALAVIFALNFGICYALLLVPGPATLPQPAAVSIPSTPPAPASPHQ